MIPTIEFLFGAGIGWVLGILTYAFIVYFSVCTRCKK